MFEPSVLLISLFAAINLLALALMWQDKVRSRTNDALRISEGTLFFSAVMLGSLGILLGMFLFRHKTRVWYFLIGIPAALVQNIIFLRAVLQWIESTVV